MPWLLTYLLHSTLLILVAALVGRLLSDRWLAVKESAWRVALFGGLVTASLQIGLGLEPLSGSWNLGEDPRPAISAPVATPVVAREVLRRGEISGIESASATPLAWRRWLVPAWLATATLLTLALGVSYLRLERRLRTRQVLRRGPVFELLRRVLVAAGVRRPVRLTSSRRIAVPLAKGLHRREICLPERALTRLSPEQQETVLAHELAHLERHDPQWLIGSRLLESVLFFQPLNRWARRQLQEIAEYRCDDWAVRQTGRPVTMARCLASVAEWTLDERRASLVPALAARRRTLKQRVDRLLDRHYPRPEEPRPPWLLPVSGALIVLTVLVAPGFSVAERPQDEAAERPEASAASEPAGAPETSPTPVTPTVAPTPEVAPVPAVAPTPEVAPVPAVAPTPEVAPVPPVAPTPQVAPVPALAPAYFDEEHRRELEAELEALAAALQAEIPRIEDALGNDWADVQAAMEAELADLEVTMEDGLAAAAEALAAHQEALEIAERVELESREEIERMIEAAEEARAAALESVEDIDIEALKREALESIEDLDVEALREEARRAAEAARPTAEELERLRSDLRQLREEQLLLHRDELRQLREQMRDVQRDELRELREQLRQLHEELRMRAREREREGDLQPQNDPQDP